MVKPSIPGREAHVILAVICQLGVKRGEGLSEANVVRCGTRLGMVANLDVSAEIGEALGRGWLVRDDRGKYLVTDLGYSAANP